jgi:DedD protein
MGFLSIFKRKASDASSPAAAPTKRPSGNSGGNNSGAEAPADEVMRARVRARRRLIGAAVLVVIGIVGFPLVFETQPRPIPVDIPIEIPKKEGAAPLVIPPVRGSTGTPRETPVPAAPPASVAAAPADDVITESRDDAGKPVAAASTPKATKPSEPKVADVRSAEPKVAEHKPAEPKLAAAAQVGDSARAKALLEGKDASLAKPESPSSSAGGRYVVQVGAFADAAAAREMRQKAEKLGLKTYTQVAATSAGNRIRVRVGPFASRDEADKALAKAKGAGLSAVVLTL